MAQEHRLIRLDASDRARALAGVPLFAGCDESQLREIAECAHMLAFEDSKPIVTEGEEGLGFYLILSGGARVMRDGNQINLLGPGEFFGEVALLEGVQRTATVLADGHAVCLGILRSDFRPLLIRQPRIALRILDVEGTRFHLPATEAEKGRDL